LGPATTENYAFNPPRSFDNLRSPLDSSDTTIEIVKSDRHRLCHCEARNARRSNLVPGSLGGREIASLRSQ